MKNNKNDIDYIEVALDLDDDFYDFSAGYDAGMARQEKYVEEVRTAITSARRDLVEDYLRYHKSKSKKFRTPEKEDKCQKPKQYK